MNQELRDPKVKVWPTSRIIVVSVIYVALATLAAVASIKVAIPRVQDMGHYQVQKTREFLGREKAKEMESFMRDNSSMSNSASPAGAAADDGSDGSPNSRGGLEESQANPRSPY